MSSSERLDQALDTPSWVTCLRRSPKGSRSKAARLAGSASSAAVRSDGSSTTRGSGTDPSSLIVDSAAPFAVRERDRVLVVTSHVTGSSYELGLPASDDMLRAWLDEIVGHDLDSCEHEPE